MSLRWAAPRFLVHFLWEFVQMNVEINIPSLAAAKSNPPPIARRTELLRRRVVQGTVWSHRVVFPPKPCPLLLGVLHVLELHPLEELVTQSTVKRFYISILPGACCGYRYRLRPHTRQPVH